MTDVRSQTAGDAGTAAFAVIGTADGVFSLPFLGNQSRLPVTGELQQVLAVLRLDKHAVLVVRVEGDLPVILFLLQDIVQSIILVFRPFSSGTVHTGDTTRAVALVLTPQAVEAGFRNDLSQPVQLEEIVVARLVADAPELQLAVVAEGDVVPFLLAAFQYSQCPIGEPDLADVVAGMYHVPHGIVLKPVHVAVRFFQPYQVVRTVVGITGNIAFHIHRLHKPSPAVVLPPAEQPVGELQQLQVVPVVERERVNPALSVRYGTQHASLVGIFHCLSARCGPADDAVQSVIVP